MQKKRFMKKEDEVKIYKYMEANVIELMSLSIPQRMNAIVEAMGLAFVSKSLIVTYSGILGLPIRKRAKKVPPTAPAATPGHYVTRDEFVRVQRALVALILELGGSVPQGLTK